MENNIDIKGMDFNKGLEHNNGRKDDFMKILRSYATGTKSKLYLLEDVNKDNLKPYEINVHSIKGSSNLIYAKDIANQASALEKAAMDGDLDFINHHNPKLLKDIGELIHNLEEMFSKIDSQKIRPKKDKPDIYVLKKLSEACDLYDMMEVDAAVTEITAYEYDSDDGLADWIKKNAEEMNYEIIVEKLKTMVGNVP